MDLKNSDDDLEIIDGDVSFVVGRAAIAQHIAMRLRTWLGESIYDRTAGAPYLQAIFVKGATAEAAGYILSLLVERTPGVISVDLDATLDRETRELRVSGTATTIDGEIDFEELLTAP